MKTRTYTELSRLETFEERFRYLCVGGVVGEDTFGFDRWLNQEFYTSREWRLARREVILRDHGCDLGIRGLEIVYGLLVHHINPMSVRDVERGESWILDPEFLITTSRTTHNAIHFGTEPPLPRRFVERKAGDTKLW